MILPARRCCWSICRTISFIPMVPMRGAGRAIPPSRRLPAKLAPLVATMRAKGAAIIATQFTLVPGRGGAPIISPHLKALRPFLKAGDFAPGSWGQRVVDDLQPVDMTVEKVAYSAFYMTRLEWLLRKLGIEALIVGGIVTNGGVASTVRDAHVRDIPVTVAGGWLRGLWGRDARGRYRRIAAGCAHCDHRQASR